MYLRIYSWWCKPEKRLEELFVNEIKNIGAGCLKIRASASTFKK